MEVVLILDIADSGLDTLCEFLVDGGRLIRLGSLAIPHGHGVEVAQRPVSHGSKGEFLRGGGGGGEEERRTEQQHTMHDGTVAAGPWSDSQTGGRRARGGQDKVDEGRFLCCLGPASLIFPCTRVPPHPAGSLPLPVCCVLPLLPPPLTALTKKGPGPFSIPYSNSIQMWDRGREAKQGG